MSDEGVAIPQAQSLSFFFHRQVLHFIAIPVLISLAWAFAARVLGHGSWLGAADVAWFWWAIGVAIVHQILGWVVFRGQLGWALLSRVFGQADLAVWGAVFLPFLVARPILVLGLAMADPGSLLLPRPVQLVLGILFLIPALYTLWSVGRFFGVARALGGDHFRTHYREMDLVQEGAFSWADNAMYAFAFLGLWAIALLLGSQAALSLALFQHAYVWVHYYCTEEPDMRLLYG